MCGWIKPSTHFLSRFLGSPRATGCTWGASPFPSQQLLVWSYCCCCCCLGFRSWEKSQYSSHWRPDWWTTQIPFAHPPPSGYSSHNCWSSILLPLRSPGHINSGRAILKIMFRGTVFQAGGEAGNTGAFMGHFTWYFYVVSFQGKWRKLLEVAHWDLSGLGIVCCLHPTMFIVCSISHD